MRSDRPSANKVTCLLLAILPAASLVYPQPASNARVRFVDILNLRGQGSYARALEQAKKLASDHPDFHKTHPVLVDLYLRLDDAGSARRYFETQLLAEPENPYAHYGLGRLDLRERDLDAAAKRLELAGSLRPSFAEVFGVDGGLVAVYEARRDLDAGIEYFETLTREDPTHANAFAGLGWIYARLFQFDRALGAFAIALELNPNLMSARRGVVRSFFRTGRYQQSVEACAALSALAERDGDLEGLAYAEMMQGTIAYVRGDYRTALVYLQQSQSLAKQIGDEAREASSVNNIAAVYATAGDNDKALEYFEMSLGLARRAGDARAEVNALTNVGSVHQQSAHFGLALSSYRDAVTLASSSGFKNQHALTLANLGEVFHRQGELSAASEYYHDALEMAEQIDNRNIEAFAAGALGSLSRERGDYADAIAHFERELAIGEQTEEVQAMWEGRAGLAAAYASQADPDKAIEHYAEAIALYDDVRKDLAIESLGGSFLEDKYEAYPSIVQLLAARGDYAEAFAYAEKFKAKGFLDILAQGQTLFETQLPEGLRRELDEVRAALQETHAALSRMRSQMSTETTIGLEERITQLELEKSALLGRVRDEHGEFYQLALSEPMDVASLQSGVLGPGQVLVEYLMGPDRLSVFVVTRDALHYREVPVGRDELRRQLGELSFLFAADRTAGSGTQGQWFNSELADFSLPPAERLYRTLLEPVSEWFPDEAELIIVPDDFLFYLPFELLVVEAEAAEHRYDFSAASFVVERYAVSYSPSASLLDPKLKRPRDYNKGVLAFGNPTFNDALDPAPRLPKAEAEVEAIDRAFSGYDNGVYTGDAATETVFNQSAQDYGVLHFATHFESDDRQPLYSRLALAGGAELGVDGILQTYEIFDATLNAELAVLSACNTGLGALRKGEGLVGISRAFLFAGVPSLVMSLWSVDDEATARIMELFYRQLRAGVSKKQALRQAKLDYLAAAPEDKKDPFYWAPFILSGDWEPLSLPEPRRSSWWLRAMLVLVVASAAAVFLQKRLRDAS